MSRSDIYNSSDRMREYSPQQRIDIGREDVSRWQNPDERSGRYDQYPREYTSRNHYRSTDVRKINEEHNQHYSNERINEQRGDRQYRDLSNNYRSNSDPKDSSYSILKGNNKPIYKSMEMYDDDDDKNETNPNVLNLPSALVNRSSDLPTQLHHTGQPFKSPINSTNQSNEPPQPFGRSPEPVPLLTNRTEPLTRSTALLPTPDSYHKPLELLNTSSVTPYTRNPNIPMNTSFGQVPSGNIHQNPETLNELNNISTSVDQRQTLNTLSRPPMTKRSHLNTYNMNIPPPPVNTRTVNIHTGVTNEQFRQLNDGPSNPRIVYDPSKHSIMPGQKHASLVTQPTQSRPFVNPTSNRHYPRGFSTDRSLFEPLKLFNPCIERSRSFNIHTNENSYFPAHLREKIEEKVYLRLDYMKRNETRHIPDMGHMCSEIVEWIINEHCQENCNYVADNARSFVNDYFRIHG